MHVFLIDAWALLCWLQNEPGAQRVITLLRKAQEGSIRVILCMINLGEVFYIVAKRAGESKAEEIVGKIKQLPLSVVQADESLVMDAARVKARHHFSYADAFAVATARRHGAKVLTGDPEYRAVSALVKIEWLKRRKSR